MGTEGNLRLIRKIKPDVLIGMPTFLYHVLTEAAARRRHFAESAEDRARRREGAARHAPQIARACGANSVRRTVDVLRTYGFTEAKLAWAECPFHEDAGSAGYHVHPDLALIEIVDPKTGELRGEGEPGEIVFTPLDARGSVVLRYRTGDCIDGGLFYEPCPFCGRNVPRLMRRNLAHAPKCARCTRQTQGHARRFQSARARPRQRRARRHLAARNSQAHDDPLELDELDPARRQVRCDDEDACCANLDATGSPARRGSPEPHRVPHHRGDAATSRASAHSSKNSASSITGRKMKPEMPSQLPARVNTSELKTAPLRREEIAMTDRLVIVDGVRTPFCRAGTELRRTRRRRTRPHRRRCAAHAHRTRSRAHR